jgi:GT2 family glycosyltransferase
VPQVAARISIVISTFNRREVLLNTLARLPWDVETFVVDNASADRTAGAVARRFPSVKLIPLPQNLGSCAKNLALPHVRGEFVVFVDDDSSPTGNSLTRMIEHFDHDPTLGAAGFTVTLPDGSRECSAYPDVFIGCGVGLRRSALEQVGGLPDDFFMQAEEYDLSLRLLDAGWSVRTFDDLHVAHLKTPQARISDRTMRLDVRNNLTLIGRHFPDQWVMPFAIDWMRRYAAIARAKGLRGAFWRGFSQGALRVTERLNRRPISDGAFEQFARIEEIRRRMWAAKARYGLRRVLFVDYGKNILPYWLGARDCGIDVVAVAVADAPLARAARHYRGAPVLHDTDALRLTFDGVVVSNLSPVHAAARCEQWRMMCAAPVIDLFERARPRTVIRRAA